jgi:hypothetical protein
MELGRRTAGLTVVDYDVAHDGSVQADLVLADRTGTGGERVVDAIIESHILTAIEDGLTASGMVDAHQFICDFLASEGGTSPSSATGKRLFTKVLRPAAVSVFDAYSKMPRRGAEGLRHYRLDHLVAMGGGRLEPVAAHFEDAATKAGAAGFRLAMVSLRFGRRHIQRVVEVELWPMVNAITDAIENSESDILLMGGDLAELPDLLEHVLSRAPVPAGRIVVRGAAEHSLDRQDATSQGLRDATHDTAVLAAYMASRNMLQSDGFLIGTNGITRSLVQDNRLFHGITGMSAVQYASAPAGLAAPTTNRTISLQGTRPNRVDGAGQNGVLGFDLTGMTVLSGDDTATPVVPISKIERAL